jgi:hypothetical protein
MSGGFKVAFQNLQPIRKRRIFFRERRDPLLQLVTIIFAVF